MSKASAVVSGCLLVVSEDLEAKRGPTKNQQPF
jgi:hypothetical protein